MSTPFTLTRRSARLLASLACSLMAACGSTEAWVDERDEDLTVDESELRALLQGELLGELLPGTPRTTVHSGTPRYRAYRFTARPGATVGLWVRSSDGDAEAWLLGAGFQTLTRNGDALEGGTDSHFQRRLMTGGTYYVAFREVNGHSANFTVTLELDSTDTGAPSTSGGGGAGGGGGGGGGSVCGGNGAHCYSSAGCCEGYCNIYGLCTGTVACSISGSHCSYDSECCSGICRYRTCNTLPVGGGGGSGCRARGTSCAYASSCCSNYCDYSGHCT